MTTRAILAEVGAVTPCNHCRGRRTCGCDTCVQGGGVCGECGGLGHFVPLTTISADEFDRPDEERLAKVVRLARRPRQKKHALGRRAKVS